MGILPLSHYSSSDASHFCFAITPATPIMRILIRVCQSWFQCARCDIVLCQMWPELSAGVTHYQTVFSREPNKIELKKKTKKTGWGDFRHDCFVCWSGLFAYLPTHIKKAVYLLAFVFTQVNSEWPQIIWVENSLKRGFFCCCKSA